MKTEDIDKRIGMPDVDKEWARFEQEVIGKELCTRLGFGHRHRSIRGVAPNI